MKLIIKDDEDRKTVVPIVRDEYAIGRQEGNHIRLTERNVSRRHARLTRKNGHVYVEDLGSHNGVKVNGDRIQGRTRVTEGDSVEIGDYLLEIEGGASAEDGDTNPTSETGTQDTPVDKTPPLAVPAPAPRTMPLAQAQAPAPPQRRDNHATAVIRLSDVTRAGEVEARDLGGNEQPRLVCVAGQMRGTEFKLRRSVVKFGRTDDGNDLVIDHQSISRSHGRFQLEDTGWKLYDNKSANGVRVNGDEYEMSPVRPGDTIELGHVKFRFVAAGEAFQLPRESAATMVPQPARGRSKAPVLIGAVVLIAAAAGAAVFVLKPSGPSAPDPTTHCAAGQSAFVGKNWDAAISSLGMARTLQAKCAFDVNELLSKARNEKAVKEQLDEAALLLEEGKFRQVIATLDEVPAGSEYSAEAKLKVTEARREGVRKYTEDAQSLLSDGRLDEAAQAIDDIAALDDQAAVVPLLRKQLSSAKAAAQTAVRERPPVAAASPGKSQEERDRTAESLTNEGIRQIKAAKISTAIQLFNKALAEKPSAAHVAKACRSLGIAHAREGQNQQAVDAYKCYLKADPNTPERAKIEKAIAQYGG